MVELVWDGKYDSDGKRTAPLRLKLPFQTVETVNESAQQRQMSLDMFSAGRRAEWRNRLIWGDKKYVLPALLDEFAGKVDLIYIDPPFNVGADCNGPTKLDSPGRVIKEQGVFRMPKRKHYTAEFKTRVVLELLSAQKGLMQASREYGIKDTILSRWKQEFLERAPQLFNGEQANDHAAEVRIAELERMVGKLTLELDLAKKALGYSNWIGKTNGE